MDPITMTDVQAQGQGPGQDEEAGFMGIALSRKARIKKNTKKLFRLNSRLDKLMDEIEETEEKLERYGVEPQELYAGWGFDDVEFDRTPSRGRGRGLTPLQRQPLPEGGDGDPDIADGSNGFMVVGNVW